MHRDISRLIGIAGSHPTIRRNAKNPGRFAKVKKEKLVGWPPANKNAPPGGPGGA